MKIGMEDDRIEEIDREVERAIAAAAAKFFNGQSGQDSFEKVGQLARERIRLTRPQISQGARAAA
jgi:hypothetical protein